MSDFTLYRLVITCFLLSAMHFNILLVHVPVFLYKLMVLIVFSLVYVDV